MFPAGQAELLFHFGDPFSVASTDGGQARHLSRATLLGPRLTRYWQIAGPRIDWFIVQLTPLGCRRIMGQPLGELVGVDQPLSTRDINCEADVWERMALDDDFGARTVVAERWLRSRLVDGPAGDAALSRQVVAMRTRPIVSVDRLAAELDVGPRRLRQRFAAELGASPKYWLSMLRAARLAHSLHPVALTAPGAQLEYADQSHALREFKRFTGLTPGRYVSAKLGGDPLVNTGGRERVDAGDQVASIPD